VRYLLIAWGEKPTGGYTMELVDVEITPGEPIRAHVELEAPGPDDIVTQALTYPHKIVSLPPGNETVMVNFTGDEWLGEDWEKDEDAIIEMDTTMLLDDRAPNPLLLEGRARVYEATFRLVVEDGHYHLAEDMLTTATAGPEWAEFAIAVPYDNPTNPFGMVIASYEDMETGEWVEEANVPLEFGSVSTALADVSGHWSEASVRLGVLARFIDGYPDGTFRPEREVTRAEFLKMLVTSEAGPEPTISEDVAVPFTDVEGHWVEPYMRWALKADWMPSGELEDAFGATFGPDQVILRQEMALLAAMAAGLEETGEVPGFTDADQIIPALAGWVDAAADAELLQGYPDGTFQPLSGLRRSEAVTVVWRVRAAQED